LDQRFRKSAGYASVLEGSMPAVIRFVKLHATAAMLIGIVLLGVLPRLSHINRRFFLDFHSWRQADTAAFTHGYLVDSFNPFAPSVDRHPCKAKSSPFGRVEAELPIIPYLAAVPLKLLGMRDASAPYLRAVSIAVFVCGCFALFACLRELGGHAIDGLLAVAAFAAAPLAIFFTRSPQPDGQSLSVAIATVWFLARYLNHRRWRDAAGTCVLASILLLMKISNAYLALVLAYMVLTQHGLRAALRNGPLWVAAIVACAVTAAWYWHAHSFSWSFGIWSEVPRDKKFANFAMLSDPTAWQKLIARLNWDILTVGGCALMTIGFVVGVRAQFVRVAAVWLLGAVIFVVATLNGQMRHAYYQLCLIPPAAIAQAAGIRFLFTSGVDGRILLALLLAVHGAITATVLWGASANASVEGPSYFTQDVGLREPIDAVSRLVPRDALLVSTERDPRLYWNSHHRGYFCHSNKTADILACMNGSTDYLLVGLRVRTIVADESSFRESFEELWSGSAYSLYRRAEQPTAP
jgi:hypothetical protein